MAIANHIEWRSGLWARPPRTKKDRSRTNGAIRSAEQIIGTVGPFALKGDVASFFPSLRPRYWTAGLHDATGIPPAELLRQLQRLRELAFELSGALGYVGLPVGTELSDIAGNAVLFAMDEQMVHRYGSAAYARYVDDFACAVSSHSAGMRVAAMVEDRFLRPLGLRMKWDKVDVVPSPELNLVGDNYEMGDDPDADLPLRWGEAYFMSRPAARGFIRARVAAGTDGDARRLAAMAPRLLTARGDLRRAFKRFGSPLSADLSTVLLDSIRGSTPRTATVSSVGDFLLGLQEDGLEKVSDAGRRHLKELAAHPANNDHTASAAGWVLAMSAETLDHRILERVDAMVPGGARGIAGAALVAGASLDRGMRRAAGLTAD